MVSDLPEGDSFDKVFTDENVFDQVADSDSVRKMQAEIGRLLVESGSELISQVDFDA